MKNRNNIGKNDIRKNNIIGSFELFLTATIWGVAFVAQSKGNEFVGAHTFNFSRNLLAFIFLLAVVFAFKRKSGKGGERSVFKVEKGSRRDLLIAGTLCGTALFIGMTFQQIGLAYTSVGKAGFITAMYIVLVPVVTVFLGKHQGIKLWIGVFLAVVGLYMLCVKEALSINKGDIIICFSAVAYTFQILFIDHFSLKVDSRCLSCFQCFIAGILSFICMILFESPHVNEIMEAWLPILYTGIMSSGVAYTLQISGQRKIKPTLASLLMSLESVISAISGWLILDQKLSMTEIIGCAFMFAAVIMAQLPERRRASYGEQIDIG